MNMWSVSRSPVPQSIEAELCDAIYEAKRRGMVATHIWLGREKQLALKAHLAEFASYLVPSLTADGQDRFYGVPINGHDVPGIVVEMEPQPKKFNGYPIWQ